MLLTIDSDSFIIKLADQGVSMAAAGLTAVMGGTLNQIEKAAKLSLDPSLFPYDDVNESAVKVIGISHRALSVNCP